MCYPPETYSLTDTGNGFWDGSIVPEEDLSYINWRIELHYENGNESSVPAEGFGWRYGQTAGMTMELGAALQQTVKTETAFFQVSRSTLFRPQ